MGTLFSSCHTGPPPRDITLRLWLLPASLSNEMEASRNMFICWRLSSDIGGVWHLMVGFFLFFRIRFEVLIFMYFLVEAIYSVYSCYFFIVKSVTFLVFFHNFRNIYRRMAFTFCTLVFFNKSFLRERERERKTSKVYQFKNWLSRVQQSGFRRRSYRRCNTQAFKYSSRAVWCLWGGEATILVPDVCAEKLNLGSRKQEQLNNNLVARGDRDCEKCRQKIFLVNLEHTHTFSAFHWNGCLQSKVYETCVYTLYKLDMSTSLTFTLCGVYH